MDPLDHLVELQLQDAEERGLLRNLPGSGKPLPDEDLSNVPAELRGSYRMLKQAGYVPEEVELRRSIQRLSDLIAVATDEGERRALRERRSAQALRFDLLLEQRGGSTAGYRVAVQHKLR